MGTLLFSMFLLLTLYMQQVLGYSAMKTGVAYLAVAGTSILWATTQQIGGALGIAALSAIATSTTSDRVADGTLCRSP